LKVHDALSGAGLAALGGVVLWHIQGISGDAGPEIRPGMVSGARRRGPWFFAVRFSSCKGCAPQGRAQPWFTPPAWIRKPRPLAGVAAIIGGLLFYVFAADSLGFYITGILLLTTWSRLLGASWRLSLGVATVATLVIHLSFYKLLRIPLPWGIFERFAF
jgi:putative tricarboxylic transport membrane protein